MMPKKLRVESRGMATTPNIHIPLPTHTHTQLSNLLIWWIVLRQKVGKCQMTRSFMSYLKWIISTLMNFLHQTEMDGFLCTFRIHPEQSILLSKMTGLIWTNFIMLHQPGFLSFLSKHFFFGGVGLLFTFFFERPYVTTDHTSWFIIRIMVAFNMNLRHFSEICVELSNHETIPVELQNTPSLSQLNDILLGYSNHQT